MSGLCGWIGTSVDEADVSALRDAASTWGATESTVAATKMSSTAALWVAGDARTACLLERDGIWLGLCGHPQWSTTSGVFSDLQQVASEIIERVRLPDVAGLENLSGDFSLVLIEPLASRCIVAVDRFGIRNVVYERQRDRILFASNIDALRRLSGAAHPLRPQALYDYLFFHVVPGPQTVFADVNRVPPASCADLIPGHTPRVRKYWSLRFEESANADFDQLQNAFLDALQSATAAASHGATSGVFLSGGTDSSTITGMLSRLSPAPVQAFSIGFDATGYDEMEYARIAARHFGAKHHDYYVTPDDVVSAVEKIAKGYDQPFGNSSAVPTYFCAKLAREHGIERLLAGDGGDELFGGNERYAKHKLLSYYQTVPEVIRRIAIEPLLLGSTLTRRLPVVRKLRSYVEQARPTMPRRYEFNNLLEHIGAANVFTPDFLATIDMDHPHGLMHAAYTPYARYELINQMLGIDLRFVLADGDLPKVTRTCELAGVDVAFPMLAAPVADLSAHLPSSMKLRGMTLRWFFKRALRNFLPPEVIAKRKHGFGLPVGTWLVSHPPLYRLARDSLDSLRPRGIVKPRFIDELSTSLLHEHSAYYGTMIWILMVLGLWLDSRRM